MCCVHCLECKVAVIRHVPFSVKFKALESANNINMQI